MALAVVLTNHYGVGMQIDADPPLKSRDALLQGPHFWTTNVRCPYLQNCACVCAVCVFVRTGAGKNPREPREASAETTPRP